MDRTNSETFDFTKMELSVGSAKDGATRDTAGGAHDFPDHPPDHPDDIIKDGGCTPDVLLSVEKSTDAFAFLASEGPDDDQHAGPDGLPPKMPDDIWDGFPEPWGPDADFPEPGPLPDPPSSPPPAPDVKPVEFDLDIMFAA